MWKRIGIWPIGGFREMGFKPNSDLLLVLSSQGRGLFDCLKNEKISRDYYDYYMEEWDSESGIVDGIGVLENEKIICGGFEHRDVLNKATPDGWKIEINEGKKTNYKNERIPAKIMYLIHPQKGTKIEVYSFSIYGPERAYGFSKTGKSFVFGISSDLHIWLRE